jgi:hypothetical protein
MSINTPETMCDLLEKQVKLLESDGRHTEARNLTTETMAFRIAQLGSCTHAKTLD